MFNLRIGANGVPLASEPDGSGQVPVYASLEERCDACQVYGGPQNPCIGRDGPMQYERIQREAADRLEAAGKERPEVWPCPRRFLDPENALAWELLPLLAAESVAFAPVFTLATADLPGDEALAIIRRIHYTIGHPEFREAKKDAERDAARRAKQESR